MQLLNIKGNVINIYEYKFRNNKTKKKQFNLIIFKLMRELN